MQVLLLALKSIFKKLFLKMATEKFLTWALLWVGRQIKDSTKTKKDDEWYDKIKEMVDE